MMYKIGDQVCLKSGGQVMTVSEVEGEEVSVVWFEDQAMQVAQLHKDCFVPENDPSLTVDNS